MADSIPPGVAQPADDLTIDFAPMVPIPESPSADSSQGPSASGPSNSETSSPDPSSPRPPNSQGYRIFTIADARDPTESQDTVRHHRPCLHHQPVGVATAKNIIQQATADSPTQQAAPQPTQQVTQGTDSNNASANFDGTEEPSGPDEVKLTFIQRIAYSLRNRRNRRSPGNQLPVYPSRSDDRWRKFRSFFSRRLPGGSSPPGNETALANSPPEGHTGDADGSGGTGVVSSGIDIPTTGPVAEVDNMLGQHRAKLSSGHEGQLKGLYPLVYLGNIKLTAAEPPNPNDPATPPKPIPKLDDGREELGNDISRPSRPPPPQPPTPSSALSNGINTATRVYPNSGGQHVLNPDGSQDGPSSSHTEYILQDDGDNLLLEAQSDDPRGPQNSPVSTVPGHRIAQIERNDDVSGLVSEVRHPPQPLSLDGSLNGGPQSTSANYTTGLLEEVSQVIGGIQESQNASSVGGLSPSDLSLQNDRLGEGVSVETEEVAEIEDR